MPSPNLRRSEYTPAYTWDERLGRYRDAQGRLVSQARIDSALERYIKATRNEMRDLSVRLQKGEIGLQEWRLTMLDEIKSLHVASTAAARGGWAQMTPADFGRVGAECKKQYDYLNRMSSQIQYGTQKLDGSFLTRVDLYGAAGRGSYAAERGQMAQEQGLTEERNRLGQADHCGDSKEREGCLEQSAKGWVKIGTLVPIGGRTCLANCHCKLEYRAG